MAEPNPENIAEFQKKILRWYKKHGRKFPWRNPSATNYEKIISEVLLQRTRAETVAKFFPIFIKKYPSWKQLGAATEQDLQNALQPIGLYKQRGNRLYKLAQEMKRRHGRFPMDKNVVAEFDMVGQYIANAYELFILKRPAPLIDVNMARVLERYFGKRKLADIRYDRYLQKVAKDVTNHNESSSLNWAILDLSAKLCTRLNPVCIQCILNNSCTYFTVIRKQCLEERAN